MTDVPGDAYRVDRAALKTLKTTFWGSGGWKRPPEQQPAEAVRHAVDCGIMFYENPVASHDEVVADVCKLRDRTNVSAVSDAFIASLTSRRLDLRSALGSFSTAQHVVAHAADGAICGICGLPSRPSTLPLNTFNFERFRWGGVRHNRLDYVAFDLAQFARAPRPDPTDEDVSLGRAVLSLLDDLPAAMTATRAVQALDLFPGSKDERATVFDVLGLAGVLSVPDRPSPAKRFTAYRERTVPPHRFVERQWPACWWRGSDGVDWAAVTRIFPRLATEPS